MGEPVATTKEPAVAAKSDASADVPERALASSGRVGFSVYSPWLARTARALPWCLVAFTVGALVVTRSDSMFISGLIAATTASFLVLMLHTQVPGAVEAVWARRLIALRDSRADPAQGFASFLSEFGRRLNSGWSFAFALLFAVAAVPQFFLAAPTRDALQLLQANGLEALGTLFDDWSPLVLAGLLFTALVGWILGLLAWRMVIVGVYVYRLGGRFDLHVQTQHPDGAGGLAPLGEVCFLNALILIVPSIFLGVWRTLIATEPTIRGRYGYVGDWFSGLLVVTFLLAVFGFVAPLYGVHRAMERERSRRQPELDEISNSMDALAQRIRTAAQSGEPTSVEELEQQHAALTDVYKREAHVPTWPVDVRIVRGYLVTQLVPFLSLTRVTDAIAARLFGTS